MPSPEVSRRNLEKARNLGRVKLWRCRDETALIKLLIWQRCFSSERLSQRAIGRELRVSQPYVCKVMRKAHTFGLDALLREPGPVPLEQFERARHVSEKLREREPILFTPTRRPRASDEPRAMTADESIAERWREVRDWKRKNLRYGGSGWFRW